MQKRKLYSFVCPLLCLFCVFICCLGNAQQSPPFKKGTDTAAIRRLLKLAVLTPNADSAIEKFKLVAQKSIESDFFLGAAQALCAAGSKYGDMGDYKNALSYSRQALPYAERSGSKSQVAFCYNLFGIINYMQGNYLDASEQYLKGLAVLKNAENENANAAITIYSNLATLSGRINQPGKKLYYINKAESLARSDNNVFNTLLTGILISKGNYFLDSSPDSAIRYYMEVIGLAGKMDSGGKDRKNRTIALADVNLGAAYLKTGDYNKAVSFCREGIELIRGKYAYIFVAGSFTLGESLRHLKKYREAEEVLITALKSSTSSNLKDQAIEGYNTLASVYRDTRQYQKALECMDSLVALKDTLQTTEKIKAISQLELKYDMAEKDRKIISNELLIAQQKNKITRKNIWINSISVAVLLIVVIAIALYLNGRQKQAVIIRSLQQENKISILTGVVQGEENERIRLARDLHDGIGGMLSATKMRFMALRHENEALIHSSKYLEAMGLLDVMGDEIRKTSHNLMPEVLLKQDLADALRTYCSNIQAGTPLHIDFQSFGTFEDLANDFKLNTYRIVQELLKNTLQHAKATYATVQLMMLEDYLTISVEDNGIGFNTGGTKDGIGLHNLKTRVLSHDGHYTIKSEVDKGTTVYIEFKRKTA